MPKVTIKVVTLTMCVLGLSARYTHTSGDNVSTSHEEDEITNYRPLLLGRVPGARENLTRIIPAEEFEADDIPHPGKEPQRCGRQRPGASLLCDPSYILSAREVEALDKTLGDFCRLPKCRCLQCPPECPGVKVGVLVLPKIKINATEDADKAVERLAESVLDSWQIGSCGDGLLVIYSARDQFTFHVSYGKRLTGEIWPVCRDAIFNENREQFVNQEIGSALVGTLEAYRSRLSGERAKDTGCRNDFPYILSTAERIGLVYGIICMPLMICVLFVFLGPCFRGPGFGGSTSKAGLSRGWTHRSTYEGYDSRWIATPSTSQLPEQRLQ